MRFWVGPSGFLLNTAPSHRVPFSIQQSGALLPLLALVTALMTVVGCASDKRPRRAELVQYDLRPDAGPATACEQEGCACDAEGETQECGSVKEKVGGYTWCALGVRTCVRGKWSACSIERVAQRRKVLNKSLLALGQAESCSEENPCQPGCNWFQDDPVGLDLPNDAGIVANDAGLMLAEVPDLEGACESIVVTPTETTLEVADAEALDDHEVTFNASLLPNDCGDENARVVWGVDRPDLASISADGVLTLLQPFAGTLTVSAYAGRLTTQASVRVHLHLADNSQAPTGTEALLNGAGVVADDVQIVYPYADTVFPLGVNPPKLQWQSVAQVEVVWNGGCALRADGRVRCWGSNFNGEIVDRNGPYVQLAGRYTHYCALTRNGDAECWGNNDYGHSEPRVGPFVQVSAGTDHSCGLRTDGTIECWGRNNYGQLNPPPESYVRVSAGSQVTCGIRTNGAIDCWGNSNRALVGTRNGPYTDVSVGASQVCAIRKDRRLDCWGGGAYGESSEPAGGGVYTMVDAGWTHNCALRTDGAAVCWGNNSDGQAVTMPGPFVDVSAAQRHSCGLLGDGRVQCWGDASDNHTLGVGGGAVRVSLRYPVTGEPSFTWSAVVAESVGDFVDPPRNTVPIAPAPRYTLPSNVWQALSQTAAGDEFALVLQRHTGDRLLEPVERRLRFASERLNGRIIYQSYGTKAIRNTTGSYENSLSRWGAVQMAYDAKTNTSNAVAGFDSASGTTGAANGCRGCHSINATGEQLISGLDDLQNALLLDDGTQPDEGFDLGGLPNSYGGFLWSALHPTQALLFTSSGPSPCATRVDGTTGTCPEASFAPQAGDANGTSVRMAASPGGLLGASYFDEGTDGVFDVATPNRFVDLSAGQEGEVLDGVLPEGLRAALPAFSPEGERLAFVHYAGNLEDGQGTVHVGDQRSLGMLDFTTQPATLGNYQRLTNAPGAPCAPSLGGNGPCVDVWPSFLASRAGVVFEREVFNNSQVVASQHSDFGGTRSGCETLAAGAACSDGSKGELRWVPLDVDGEPEGDFALARANGTNEPGQLVTDGPLGVIGVKHPREVEPFLNYQPSAAPRGNGKYTWVAFVSRRAYGNLATENAWWSDPRVHPLRHAMSSKKIWVTALDTQSGANDPSAPAFLLEGQEMQGSNGRPVWTSNVCIEPAPQRSVETECTSDADCCGAPDMATCSLQLPAGSTTVRHCVPKEADACIEPGSEVRCESDADCCGADVGQRCVSSQCVQPPPLARYEARTFVRDFHAECPAGDYPAWQLLQWQAELPPGTSIDFTGQTADELDELDDALSITLGSAQPPSTTTWTSWGTEDEDNIGYKFEQAAIRAGVWLRVTMTLNPDDRQIASPVLTDWRVIYDCSPTF